MAGGTVTISGGNVIHTFTSSGYLTPIKYASRSLRFRSSASAYLNRTNSTPTSGSTFTVSFWVKRGTLGANQTLMSGTRPGNFDRIYFTSSDTLIYQWNDGSSNLLYLETTQLFRDPSAWYHIVVVTNTTQATSSNRAAIYINGVQVTAFSTATYPSQNATSYLNASGVAVNLGRTVTGTLYYDGYLTEINFIDGAALTPSSFGTFNSYGVWQPITYGGSYGTNGFYLTFGNNTSTTTLGYDTSPQGNNWTTNNISLTAGTTYDSMTDVPTLTSATVANYATLNPLQFAGTNGSNPSDGNLTVNSNGSANPTKAFSSTIAASTGKFYAEFTISSVNYIQIAAADVSTWISTYGGGLLYGSGTISWDLSQLKYYINSTGSTATGITGATNDVLQIAFDANTRKVWFGRNNTWNASGNPSAGTGEIGTVAGTGSLVFVVRSENMTTNCNFGQQGFTYTPPSGFVALNTYNLTTPTIPNGAVYMAATTYTGTGAALTVANTVNGTSFQPDWVWVKGRSGTTDHALYDVLRGTTKQLESNNTDAETTESTGLTAFGSTGFTVGALAQMNTSAATYVAWQWAANGAGVSNTSGSITSTVSANTTAGFSVVTYTGTNTAATVGHGLGVAPSMIIVKQRNSAVENWLTYHSSLTNPTTSYLYLNSTAAQATTASYWNGGPTSSVFGIGAFSGINASAGTYVAYVFAAVAGYSAFGSYTSNASTDGPFVFLGFRPRFIMLKRSSAAGAPWSMIDTSRSPYNAAALELDANSTAAEYAAGNGMDVLSNGFKLRASDYFNSGSGETFIYAAFAENPFKYSNAR
jgi:hypothetical protein